jgi:hypothetical protein
LVVKSLSLRRTCGDFLVKISDVVAEYHRAFKNLSRDPTDGFVSAVSLMLRKSRRDTCRQKQNAYRQKQNTCP